MPSTIHLAPGMAHGETRTRISMGQLARLYLENQLAPENNIQFLQADNTLRSLAEATGGAAFFPRLSGGYLRVK